MHAGDLSPLSVLTVPISKNRMKIDISSNQRYRQLSGNFYFIIPLRKESCCETVTFFSETLECGKIKRVAPDLSPGLLLASVKCGGLPHRAVVDSAGHTVITQYVSMMGVLAAAVFIEKETGPEAEVTNDLM